MFASSPLFFTIIFSSSHPLPFLCVGNLIPRLSLIVSYTSGLSTALQAEAKQDTLHAVPMHQRRVPSVWQLRLEIVGRPLFVVDVRSDAPRHLSRNSPVALDAKTSDVFMPGGTQIPPRGRKPRLLSGGGCVSTVFCSLGPAPLGG